MACSAASNSRRSSSAAPSMARGLVARRAALPLFLRFAATLDFDSIASLHAVTTNLTKPRRKSHRIDGQACGKRVTTVIGFASPGDADTRRRRILANALL